MPKSKHKRKPSRQAVRRAVERAEHRDAKIGRVVAEIAMETSAPDSLAELREVFAAEEWMQMLPDPEFLLEATQMLALIALTAPDPEA